MLVFPSTVRSLMLQVFFTVKLCSMSTHQKGRHPVAMLPPGTEEGGGPEGRTGREGAGMAMRMLRWPHACGVFGAPRRMRRAAHTGGAPDGRLQPVQLAGVLIHLPCHLGVGKVLHFGDLL